MNAIEIARRCVELGQETDAVKAYTLAAEAELTAEEQLEAGAYLLEHGGDYKISYSIFVRLYNADRFHAQLLPLMDGAFYQPNIRMLKNRYERNVKLLQKYPYLFKKDFLPFDELPLVFFPYDDSNGYMIYDTEADMFPCFVNVKNPVVSRNFFKDLEKPILASDVYSQYELEYLVDNVRPSEWVARENHIYLHYTDWAEFCSWLTVLSMKPLLEKKKIVFLIGDELSQYPIDFKQRFGIDYSQYTVEPVHIREVNKLIWHTQFSSSNGGDFFNEVFDAHPNLCAYPSIMFTDMVKTVSDVHEAMKRVHSLEDAQRVFSFMNNPSLVRDLYALRSPSDKDCLVAAFLRKNEWAKSVDPAARIVPAIFFQPHFPNMIFDIKTVENYAVLDCEQMDAFHASAMICDFKYIKTFTPLRRFTTAYGSTLRFMKKRVKDNETIPDLMMQRILNRSYLRNPEDRLFRDSVVVRFEDGKLNPRATFTRLAAFLDIPYTDSMTYCSEKGVHDVQTEEGNAVGFDPVTVYKKYEDWINDDERYYMEWILRDAYAFYQYGFQAYDGKPVDEERVKELIHGFTTLDEKIADSFKNSAKVQIEDMGTLTCEEEVKAQATEVHLQVVLKEISKNRLSVSKDLMRNLRFVNKNLQPLEFIPMLEPDPDLLDQPLYH